MPIALLKSRESSWIGKIIYVRSMKCFSKSAGGGLHLKESGPYLSAGYVHLVYEANQRSKVPITLRYFSG